MNNIQYVTVRPTRYFSKCLFCPKQDAELKYSNFYALLNINGVTHNIFHYICDRCDLVNCKRFNRVIDRMIITQKVVDKYIPVPDLANIVMDYLAEDVKPKFFKSEGIVR